MPHGFRLKPEVAGLRRWGAFAFLSFSSARAHDFSISREAGATLTLGVRRRWDAHADAPLAEQYTELVGQGMLYHAFRVSGFANHVLALRVSALERSGATVPTTSLGGASGQPLGFGLRLASIGTRRFLPVRGFRPDARRGTHGWSASLEYRLPLALVARGHGLLPLFLDDIAAAFLDAGDAWCTADQQAAGSCDPNRPAGAHAGHPLVGAGGELALDLAAYYNLDFRLRAGVGVPVSGTPAGGPGSTSRSGPRSEDARLVRGTRRDHERTRNGLTRMPGHTHDGHKEWRAAQRGGAPSVPILVWPTQAPARISARPFRAVPSRNLT